MENAGINVIAREHGSQVADTILKDEFKLLVIIDSESLDALQVARELQAKGIIDKLNVLIISSNDKHGNYVKSKRLGIDGYLTEPIEPQEIEQFIAEHFTGVTIHFATVDDLDKNISIIVAEDNLINQKVAQTVFKNLG
ncbi:MAG: hypothetical protein HC896_03530 [Bacteroidales bacterium]|nr:hypothetical protein [Bacteroidales bacterium]